MPVIANGDICNASDARAALHQSGADGVMVGRGAQGQPWLLAQIAADLQGGVAPVIPQGNDFITLVAEHFEDMLSFYGPKLGAKVARKHLSWYMDYAGTDAQTRRAILTAPEPAEVLHLLPDALHTQQSLAA